MLSVLGCDYSSSAIDLVYLNEDTDTPRWHRIPLRDGWKAAREMRGLYAWPAELETAGVYLVAIEQPMMQQRNAIAALYRLQGAILAAIPREIEVWLVTPTEWKLTVGIKGNNVSTQKGRPGYERLHAWACMHGADPEWPIDAAAALAMAWTAREINEEAIGRSAA